MKYCLGTRFWFYWTRKWWWCFCSLQSYSRRWIQDPRRGSGSRIRTWRWR